MASGSTWAKALRRNSQSSGFISCTVSEWVELAVLSMTPIFNELHRLFISNPRDPNVAGTPQGHIFMPGEASE